MTEEVNEPTIRRVLIGTVCPSGKVESLYTTNLLQTTKLCTLNMIDLQIMMSSNEPLGFKAKNDFVKYALDHNYDDLILIDHNVSWNAQWILTLLNKPVDVVGAAVAFKMNGQVAYNVFSKYPIEYNEELQLFKVLSLSCGLIRFSKNALIQLANASDEYESSNSKVKLVFENDIVEGKLFNEDSIVCFKLNDLGIPVWVDSTMTCSSITTEPVNGSFVNFYNELVVRMNAKIKEEKQEVTDVEVPHINV